MASVKVTWLLFNVLGYPAAILSLITAIFGDITGIGDIGEPFKTIIVILGIMFLIIKVLIFIESYFEKRIANAERRFNLHIRKQEYLSKGGKLEH